MSVLKKIYRIFGFPLFIFILTESLFAGGIIKFTQWLIHEPIYAIFSLIIIFSYINIFYLFKPIIYKSIAIILSFCLLLIAFISHTKYQYRGDVVTTSDIFLLNEASDISSYLNSSLYIKLSIYLLIFLIISLLLIINKNPALTISKRIFLSVGSILILLTFVIWVGPYVKSEKQVTILPGKNSTGYIAGLISGIKNTNTKNDSVYSKSRITEIKNSLPSNSENKDFKPNVIMVLSEAFWDPTQVDTIKFAEDPLPFYHSLVKEYSSGEILSPVFGGSTANPEFESLTGLSTHFIDDPTPYVQSIKRPLDSLASIFKTYGYESSVVHSYHNWFYNRPNVYQNLGFDKFISGEFFNTPTMIGPFMDDKDLYDSVLREIQATENPNFIYTITMLNHGPYKSDRFEDKKTNPDIVSGELSKSSNEILNAYSHSLKYVDQALEKLINDLNGINEPTILVFFGDHLPLLGEDYAVYKELNFFNNSDTLLDYQRKFTTPIIVWNNFGAEKEDLGIQSTNFIGEYVLNLSEKQGNNIFSSLSQLRQKGITVIPEEQYYEDFLVNSTDFEDFRLLQYDVLFGKDYSETNPKQATLLKRGSSDLKIDSTTPSKIITGVKFYTSEGPSVLNIQGSGFIQESSFFDFIKGSQIYINNEPYDTIYSNENLISTVIPEELYNKPDEISIDVRITDTKGSVLSESNQLIIPILDQENITPIIKWAEPGNIIKHTPFNEVNGKSYLKLAGEGFTNDSKIFINNIPMESTIEDNGYIQCFVPNEFYNQPTVWTVNVRTGSKQSNELSLYVTD